MQWLADLDAALAILIDARDIIAERPGAELPSWVERRGWTRTLDSMSRADVAAAERDPARWLAAHPHDELRTLGSAIVALTSRYEDASMPAMPRRERHVKHRKRQQIEAFCALAERLAGDGKAGRIVDLGSGHGHLTRALASAMPAESLGIDANAERVARALQLGGRFVHGDAAHQDVRSGDLVVGLHPCGALGDALVERAREGGAHVLMVSCCFQKTASSERVGLSTRAKGWVVPRTSLGLANLAVRSFEGSGSLESKRAGRQTRMALRFALAARGVEVGPGDEARGVTKERIARGLHHAATHAFERRGLDAPTESELDQAKRTAALAHDRLARWALPRHALARVLEIGIVLDRACFLHEGGWSVEVRPLFSSRVSPRNLAIVGRAPRAFYLSEPAHL